MDNTYILSMKAHISEMESDLKGLSDILSERPLNRYEAKARERLIQTLVEACIGIAKHRCKQLGFPAPDNAYVAFERLTGQATAHTETTEPTIDWKRIIGMRNALVHDYLNINPDVIEQLIRNREYTALVAYAHKELIALNS